MLGPVVGVTAALGAVVALVGPAAAVDGTAGRFGGTAKVQLAHIGKIEVDLEATSAQRSAPRPLRTRRERVDGVLRRPSLIRPRRAPAGSVHAVNRTSVSGQAHPSTS